MREILFRGKRTDNGEWVEGGFYSEDYSGRKNITYWNSFGLGFMDYKEVYSATVGQYAGRKDKNGIKIFEGDILKGEAVIDGESETVYLHVAYMNDDIFGCGFFAMQGEEFECIDKSICSEFTVAGNIYDNPELLREE